MSSYDPPLEAALPRFTVYACPWCPYTDKEIEIVVAHLDSLHRDEMTERELESLDDYLARNPAGGG